MKTQHTAGKWTVVDSGGTVISARESTYVTICKLENLPLRISAEVEANAKLIAAAPELLNACMEFDLNVSDLGKLPAGYVTAWTHIKEAINKATE